jgi:uncharacterized protein (TIGR00369 family)
MQFQVHIPFVEHLGFELVRFEGGESELALTLREELTNSWGVAHGGVVMTLLDVALAHAARSPDTAGGDTRPGVVTVEMKTSFLAPGLGRLRATGRALRRTTSLAFCEGSVWCEDGTLAAHATGTFKFMRGLPTGTGGRRIQRLNASD